MELSVILNAMMLMWRHCNGQDTLIFLWEIMRSNLVTKSSVFETYHMKKVLSYIIFHDIQFHSLVRRFIFISAYVTDNGKLTCYIYVYTSYIYMGLKLISQSAAYMRQWNGSALVEIMVCRLFGAKSLSESMLTYCQLDP